MSGRSERRDGTAVRVQESGTRAIAKSYYGNCCRDLAPEAELICRKRPSCSATRCDSQNITVFRDETLVTCVDLAHVTNRQCAPPCLEEHALLMHLVANR